MKISIQAKNRNIDLIILTPKKQKKRLPAILWIHGGDYALGSASMVHFSVGKMLAKKYGAIVVSPNYTLSKEAPYPAAFEDCYAALEYLYDHTDSLNIDKTKIIVGGESAGGGLAAAVCLKARDEGRIPIALQIPLYPMLDCEDTPSSRDNHGYVWNTKRNHWGWSLYLSDTKDPDPYASPAKERDYRDLPPCLTYVEDGEPFYDETMTYIENLKNAGVDAKVRVFHGKTHAFDMMLPWTKNARQARKWILKQTESYLI